jgi:hypothetical protein
VERKGKRVLSIEKGNAGGDKRYNTKRIIKRILTY